MIIKSTVKEKAIPYHEKVILNFTRHINSIDPGLLGCNPILSGSNAIKYIYSPSSEANDTDLYFSSKNDYEKALQLLSSRTERFFTTQNATSFNEFKTQLIKKSFLQPEAMILTHDFSNVACAITLNAIFTTKKTNHAWYNQELHLQRFQVSENPTDTERLICLTQLIDRIYKYKERYSLTLSDELKNFLYTQKAWLEAHKSLEVTIPYVEEVVLDYYGAPIQDRNYSVFYPLSSINSFLNLPFTDTFSMQEEFAFL